MKNTGSIKWSSFLKDVFICSLSAFAGPEAHVGVFLDQLVTKKKYLSEKELIELVALSSMLPGPSSTQIIVATGYKTGGPLLGLITLLVWALPVLVFMTALSFLNQLLDTFNISVDNLRFIGPMAVGFIVVAAYKIGRKVVTDRFTLLLFLFSATTTYLIRAPWVFPVILLIGGGTSVFLSRQKNLWNRVKLDPPWVYLALFICFAVGGIFVVTVWDELIAHLFEGFYRFGYLVFGGGQVVVPMMYSELVEIRQYLTSQEFLTGYGFVQGLPGPMFSFSAYVGGLAAASGGPVYQIIGALVSGIGIFLPGMFLIYFVYPIWEGLKQIRGIGISLKGINAAAGGLISIAAFILMQQSGFSLENIIVTALTIILLTAGVIPTPLIVLLALGAGFIF